MVLDVTIDKIEPLVGKTFNVGDAYLTITDAHTNARGRIVVRGVAKSHYGTVSCVHSAGWVYKYCHSGNMVR